MTPLLCLVVLLSATLIDFAHARCVIAIADRAPHRAAMWSIVQWGGATVGFIIAVKVTFWVLPFEAAGLYVGTLLAIRPSTPTTEGVTLAEPRRSQRISIEMVRAGLERATSATWS